MKRFIQTVLMLMLVGVAYSANNRLKVQDVSIKPGETRTLNIELENESSNLMGWQCDITLPTGFSLELNKKNKPIVKLGDRFSTTEHTASSSVLSNGSYRIVVTSLDGDAIPENSGTIFSVNLKADASVTASATLQGTISKIEFNTQDNQKLVFNDVPIGINIDGGTPLDYNLSITSSGNGHVTCSGYNIKDNTQTITINEGSSVLLSFVPDNGYRLASLKVDGVDVISEITNDKYEISSISKNTSIIAVFVANKYKLTYKVDGVEYKSSDVEYGASITPEPVPTKEGYTFSGWNNVPTTMPAHDVTVTGSFTKGTYKLTYVVDGKVYKTISCDYGTVITPEAAPSKEGYTFSGWGNIPTTMPAHDVTVTGSFTINKYKLTYLVDGVEYKSSDVEYGASITPEPVPTKEGYTFSGWNNIPTTMPAHDVTVTGSFRINNNQLANIVEADKTALESEKVKLNNLREDEKYKYIDSSEKSKDLMKAIDAKITEIEQTLEDIENDMNNGGDDDERVQELTDQLNDLLAGITDAIAGNDVNSIDEMIDNAQAEYDKYHKRGDTNMDSRMTMFDYNFIMQYVREELDINDIPEEGKKRAEQLSQLNVVQEKSFGTEIEINITDAVGTLKIYLNDGSDEGLKLGDRYYSARSAEQESIVASTQLINGMKRIALSLNGASEFTAAQFDVILPEGMKIVGAQMGEISNGHDLFVGSVKDGRQRVVISNSQLNAFNGSEGAVVYLDVEGAGDVQFNNVIFFKIGYIDRHHGAQL